MLGRVQNRVLSRLHLVPLVAKRVDTKPGPMLTADRGRSVLFPAPRQIYAGGYTMGMGFHEKHQVSTWLGEGGLDFSRAKCRLLFKCELDLGPGQAEEILFTVGPDESGEWMLLCRETEWSNEGYSVVAGVPTGTFPEPEIWARLLEAYLRALKKAEGYEGHEFTSVKTAPRGPLPKAEIRAVLEKVFE